MLRQLQLYFLQKNLRFYQHRFKIVNLPLQPSFENFCNSKTFIYFVKQHNRSVPREVSNINRRIRTGEEDTS